MKLKGWGLVILILITLVNLAALIDPETASIPLPQDPALLTGKLPNGLTYYIQANKQPEKKAELRLFVNAGSICEDDDQRGLAHFTEHMCFNGTKNFAKSEMLDFLNSVGMGFMNGLNGGTTYDYTMYMFKIPTDNAETLRKGFVILSDMAYQVSFDPKELEKERGVIIEEWRMGQNANSRVSAKTDGVLYAGSKYADRSPIGTYEVLSTFKPETIKRFYTDWYRPDLQSVVVVGDVDPQAILALITEYFGKIPASQNPRPRIINNIPSHEQPKAVVAIDKELPMSSVKVQWKTPPTKLNTLGDAYDYFTRNLFYSMVNARLQERGQSATPPYSYAYSFEYPVLAPISLVNLVAIFGDGKAESALKALIQEVERIRKNGFTQSELDRAKQSFLRESETQLADKDTRESDAMTWEFMSVITRGEAYLSPEQSYALANTLIPEITLDECNNQISKLISTGDQVYSIEGVDKPGVTYPTGDELLQIAANAVNDPLPDYVDKVNEEPILAEIPKPGKIVKDKLYKKTGIKEWTLSNGIKVYSKKTDFKNDEVLCRATSPGGYSKQVPENMEAAKYLSMYLEDSGVGNLDKISLDRAMTGKIASVSLNVSMYEESMQASCSPTDLELMFQLMYQYARKPYWDETALASNLSRMEFYYQNRALDPESAFFDTLYILAKKPNPYNKNTDAGDLAGITLEQLKQIYEDRFGDFSDFSFTFVGNFDEALLREYCARYLANLPTKGRKEKIGNTGMQNEPGKKEIVFKKGGAQKSYVGLISNSTGDMKQQTSIDRSAMLMVLNEKLRENIREERSGVYFVQTYTAPDRYPTPQFSTYTIMSCNSERVPELTDAVIATMDSVKAGLFDDKYIASARATLEKRYEESIRQNDFWLSQISSRLSSGAPLDEFLDNPAKYAKLNRKAIVRSANRFLTTDKSLIKVIMMPEDETP